MDLTQDLRRYLHWDRVEKIGSTYFVRFDEDERTRLRNIGASGPDLKPALHVLARERTQTFYLTEGEGIFRALMAVPIVFDVTSTRGRDKTVHAKYQHWTLAGWLHRHGDEPAYKAVYGAHGTVDKISMYFCSGVRHREQAPSMELYRGLRDESRSNGSVIQRFNMRIQECSYLPDWDGDSLPDPRNLRSWPYPKRITLHKGRQLLSPSPDGPSLRELTAKTAEVTWDPCDRMGSGVYPARMVMKNFHEFWENGRLKARRARDLRSKWMRIRAEDNRPLTSRNVRDSSFSNLSFDRNFIQLLTRVGFTDRPFYADSTVEFAVLTELLRND